MNLPTKEALIVAHGQPSAPVPPELWLMAFAAKTADHLPGWTVRSATLAMPDALEEQVVQMPDNSFIFPMFMSDGWFVSRVLPKRLNGAPLRILTPLGFLTKLPEIAADILTSRIKTEGWATSETRILLAAHGSAKGPKAAEAAYQFASQLSEYIPQIPIEVGFIEQAPFVKDAAKKLPPQTLCLPFFALEGDHCREDIPEALDAVNFSGILLQPLGTHDIIPKLAAEEILNK